MIQTLELVIWIFSEPLPTAHVPADFMFLFGQTLDNQESVLQMAEKALLTGITQRVGFLQSPALSGYPGYDAWHQMLSERGIKSDQLEGVPFDNPTMIHTRIEAEAMILYTKKQNFRQIYITAAPFHQLRAFMTAVTVALEHYPTVKLHSLPGKPLPWLEKVAHSQGQVLGTRSQLIAGEWERIEKYTQKGDLATITQVLDYLNQRDS